MPAIFSTSAARIAANRRSAAKSTGPRTEAGKARSRANAVKHGLTGAGIALPVEDAVEVDRRFSTIQGELAPQTVLGADFTHQVALMTVRCQRAARQESAALATQIRRAATEFDLARAAEAKRLFARIGIDPQGSRSQLLALPEGVDRLVGGLLGLRDELAGDEIVWQVDGKERVDAYLGRRSGDLPHSRAYRLGMAIEGDYSELDPGEYAHLATPAERSTWAADELIAIIDAEVARLRAHRATLDHEAIALERAEAGDCALFDPGKEATLARKYEAASSRALYRALQELREVEVEGAIDLLEADDEERDAEVNPATDEADPENGPDPDAELGSFEPTPGARVEPTGFADQVEPVDTVCPPVEGSGRPQGRRRGGAGGRL